MTDKEVLFHDLTIIDSINIFRKNFTLPLDKIGRMEDIHTEIFFDEKITPIPELQNSLYISKDIVVKVLAKIDNKENIIADIGIVVTFRFNNTDVFIRLLHDQTYVDPDLSEWLTNIALATARGVIFSEFRGTYIGSIIIPIIKPKDLK